MEANVSVRCAFCGNDIPVDEARYSIGGDMICTDCAATATLSDLYISEKVGGVSFFDGKIWWNPFDGPDYEGDTGVEYDAEIPATPYDKYVVAWNEKYNPNRMIEEEYEKLFFEGKPLVKLLSREEFDAKGYSESDIEHLITVAE